MKKSLMISCLAFVVGCMTCVASPHRDVSKTDEVRSSDMSFSANDLTSVTISDMYADASFVEATALSIDSNMSVISESFIIALPGKEVSNVETGLMDRRRHSAGLVKSHEHKKYTSAVDPVPKRSLRK